MYFCSCVEIDLPFLVPFAEDDARPFLEVNVNAVHSDQFADTHSSGCQQVYHRKIADFGAGITKFLQLLISESFLDQRVSTDFVDSSDR